MLYEFHRKQNAKHSGSVHATYVVTGIKIRTVTPKPSQQDPDGDSTMRSSPPLPDPSSPVVASQADDDDESIPIKSIMLVREEHLEEARNLFQQILSIHVYSLAAKGLSEIQTLTECNRKVATAYANEDPMTKWKKYGTIQNGDVRRRTAKGPPPAAAPAPAKAPPVKSAPAPAANTAAAPTAAESKPVASKAVPDAAKTTTSSATKPAAGNKATSSIFASFAKSAAKPKKTESQELAPAAPANQDVAMGGFSDDEDDDASLPEELADIKVPGGKSKKEREAELQAMMDQEDEDEEMKDEESAEEEVEAADEEEPAAEEKPAPAAAEPEETSTVQNGKRRGRRRVMKKKTVRDEEGYLGEFFVGAYNDADSRLIFLTRQSRKKRLYGSHSRKTKRGQQRRRARRNPRASPQRIMLLPPRQRRAAASRGKVVSCRSLARNDSTKLQLNHTTRNKCWPLL